MKEELQYVRNVGKFLVKLDFFKYKKGYIGEKVMQIINVENFQFDIMFKRLRENSLWRVCIYVCVVVVKCFFF